MENLLKKPISMSVVLTILSSVFTGLGTSLGDNIILFIKSNPNFDLFTFLFWWAIIAGIMFSVYGFYLFKVSLDNKHNELKSSIKTLNKELNGNIETFNTELKGNLETLNTELKDKIEEVKNQSSNYRTELINYIHELKDFNDERLSKIEQEIRELKKTIKN